jgi:hypothetical protein
VDEDSSQFAARCEALRVPRRGSIRIGDRLCLRSVPGCWAGGAVFEWFDVAGVPTARGFQAVQTVASTLVYEIVSINFAGLTARARASFTMLTSATLRSPRSIPPT